MASWYNFIQDSVGHCFVALLWALSGSWKEICYASTSWVNTIHSVVSRVVSSHRLIFFSIFRALFELNTHLLPLQLKVVLTESHKLFIKLY